MDKLTGAQWIKQRRSALNLTQEQLAERAGCQIGMVKRVEAGTRHPSPELAAAFAAVLRVPLADIDLFIQSLRAGSTDELALPEPSATLTTLLQEPVSSLPSPRTSFLGRGNEMEVCQALLGRGDVRLLTLTGPGGTGKTRLAIQVGATMLNEFPDGVFFVPLAAIKDGTLVAAAIADHLGVTEYLAPPLAEALATHLSSKKMLLVLDNFEQVQDASSVISLLLTRTQHLKILVTSRVVLRVYGEHEFSVAPLALPNLQLLPDVESLAQYGAIQLFVKRAQAVRPNFTLTEENARAVAEICVRLDGLPLAIELAAAHSKVFTPQNLLRRLNRRLTLAHGAADLPERQQSLRSTLAWSYDLLNDTEQTLFARLAVFNRGWTIEAAEAVCTEPESDGLAYPASSLDILDGLTSLVDKSLLWQQESATGEPRFRMLETIHEYALELLEASGEVKTLLKAHALYYTTLLEAPILLPDGSIARGWLEQMAHEHDNLSAALDWAYDSGELEIAMRLSSAIWESGVCTTIGSRITRAL